jgi:endonuclease YncB( thermonuclease family)
MTMLRAATAIASILAFLLCTVASGEIVRVTAEQTQLYDAQTKEAKPVSIQGKRFMVYGFAKDWYLIELTINKDKVFRWVPKADVEVDWGSAKVVTATVAAVRDVNTFELTNGTRLQFRRVEVPANGTELAGQTLAWLKKLLEGKQVTLELDTMDPNARGFREAYVYVDNACVNRLLVEHGLARVSDAGEPARYDAVLTYYAERAAEAKQGIWAQGPTPTAAEARVAGHQDTSPDTAVDSTPPRPRRLTPAQLTQWSLRLQVEVKVCTEQIDEKEVSGVSSPATGANDGIVVSGPRAPEFDGIVPAG